MEGVVISASGNHVTKAVTIVELLKKKLPVCIHHHRGNIITVVTHTITVVTSYVYIESSSKDRYQMG